MNILAQTLQLAIRIAIVWAGGFIIAVAIRAALPEKLGFNISTRKARSLCPSTAWASGPACWPHSLSPAWWYIAP